MIELRVRSEKNLFVSLLQLLSRLPAAKCTPIWAMMAQTSEEIRLVWQSTAKTMSPNAGRAEEAGAAGDAEDAEEAGPAGDAEEASAAGDAGHTAESEATGDAEEACCATGARDTAAPWATGEAEEAGAACFPCDDPTT